MVLLVYKLIKQTMKAFGCFIQALQSLAYSQLCDDQLTSSFQSYSYGHYNLTLLVADAATAAPSTSPASLTSSLSDILNLKLNHVHVYQ